jgi:hypothetical protein
MTLEVQKSSLNGVSFWRNKSRTIVTQITRTTLETLTRSEEQSPEIQDFGGAYPQANV